MKVYTVKDNNDNYFNLKLKRIFDSQEKAQAFIDSLVENENVGEEFEIDEWDVE